MPFLKKKTRRQKEVVQVISGRLSSIPRKPKNTQKKRQEESFIMKRVKRYVKTTSNQNVC